jgi:hypothetical protein
MNDPTHTPSFDAGTCQSSLQACLARVHADQTRLARESSWRQLQERVQHGTWKEHQDACMMAAARCQRAEAVIQK